MNFSDSYPVILMLLESESRTIIVRTTIPVERAKSRSVYGGQTFAVGSCPGHRGEDWVSEHYVFPFTVTVLHNNFLFACLPIEHIPSEPV